eukprot:m.352048 g.352048  ORF g.352048 m.352048 type:complete len:74 (+) comp16425_c0_seq1:271-492(+)
MSDSETLINMEFIRSGLQFGGGADTQVNGSPGSGRKRTTSERLRSFHDATQAAAERAAREHHVPDSAVHTDSE